MLVPKVAGTGPKKVAVVKPVEEKAIEPKLLTFAGTTICLSWDIFEKALFLIIVTVAGIVIFSMRECSNALAGIVVMFVGKTRVANLALDKKLSPIVVSEFGRINVPDVMVIPVKAFASRVVNDSGNCKFPTVMLASPLVPILFSVWGNPIEVKEAPLLNAPLRISSMPDGTTGDEEFPAYEIRILLSVPPPVM